MYGAYIIANIVPRVPSYKYSMIYPQDPILIIKAPTYIIG